MKTSQQGFNIIEAMVAAVVLAVGLLGVAGLQLSGLRANQGSYFRSQASAVMLDMIERIHNNRLGADTGAYAQFTTANCAAPPTICAAESGGANPPATGCNAAQMATYDRYVVFCGVRGAGGTRIDGINPAGTTPALPQASIAVDCLDNAGAAVAAISCAPGSRYRVNVSWTEMTQPDGANAGQVLAQVQTLSTIIQP